MSVFIYLLYCMENELLFSGNMDKKNQRPF